MQRFLLPCLSLAVLTLLAQQGGAPSLTADSVSDLAMRNIPGTFSSGRIADVAVDPRNRSVFYVATASGGLWKTSNRGVSFEPIFDHGGSYSLGCVTLDPKNPDIVWLGTGENQAQRAIGYGDGIYKSTDAGATWKNMGLPDSEHIGRIWVDPRNSNTVWVAAQGPLFSAGGDRGLYKTTDGGLTWKASLTITPDTGVTDFDIDPRNPDIMYAASYQRRRTTSIIIAGGPDSAIYKTTDAGAHWAKLTDGIPTVDKGRIALAVSPQKPDTIYATITTNQQNKFTGMYRSDDAGAHWAKLNDFVVQDPEYYGEIFADPFKEGRVYLMDMVVRVSEDFGKTITAAGWQVHADNHALTFDPADPNHLLEGNDGGLYETYDHGRTWRHFNNIPVTQFYRVSVDNARPFYNIYGGTQDNGSQGVPSRTLNRIGIRTSDWMNTGGGDGFQSRADYTDPNTVYACSQNIACNRLDLKSGATVAIRPRFGDEDAKLRSRWDIPFIISPHSHTRLYIAANRLMRSDDRGDTWKLVSPDLTRNLDRDTIPVMGKLWGADAVWKNAYTDQFGTATAVAESPVKEGVLIVGTDDGLVQISEDAGQTWRKSDTFPGAPDMTYITDVHASPHDANTVFVTLNDFHRGNFKPYIMKSTDLGKTWISVSGDLPQRDPVWTVVQDPVNPNLLFAGTEFGLSFTPDGGRQWVRIKGGMPITTIRDLEIQARESDLVAGSFGRGFFVLDDYAALRGLSAQALSQEGVLFAPGRKARLFDEINFYRAQGDNVASPNPPPGALLTYYVRDEIPNTKLVLTVLDATGKHVRQLDATNKSGLHRTSWDLREAPPTALAGGRGGRGGPRTGPQVKPGLYQVTLAKLSNGALTPIGQPIAVEVQ
ncbi:MAG: glycosyl hydrolase [Candidatus Solibacter sp.]